MSCFCGQTHVSVAEALACSRRGRAGTGAKRAVSSATHVPDREPAVQAVQGIKRYRGRPAKSREAKLATNRERARRWRANRKAESPCPPAA